MKFRVTVKSALLGLVVFIIFVLQSVAKVSGGKWSQTLGIAVALAGTALGLAIAVTATSAEKAEPASRNRSDTLVPAADRRPRQLRNSILQWLGFVVIFLLVFRLLDTFHVNWRQYLH